MGKRLGDFDLQAHRGGMGLTVENTLAAFRTALHIGVTTLECDVNLSADGVPMVTHDRVVSAAKFCDTEPVTPGDPQFPYVGRFVSRLTAAQLKTLDGGSLTIPDLPGQRAVPGEPMPRLDQLLDLVAGVPDVRVNVETKFDVVHPAETAPRAWFAEQTVAAIRRAGLVDRVSVQSFDWEVLKLVARAEPRIARYALTGPKYLEVGRPGRSDWLGGLDIDDFGGDLVAAVAALGFTAVSPIHGMPYESGVRDPAYQPFVTAALVDEAHDRGILVVPYTVDDPATMAAFVDLGADGFITNYPDRAREVLAGIGVPLPAPVR
ncbi:MAG: glycerophosphodiester phosphodiesterase family protein [Marmoricola sp.]